MNQEDKVFEISISSFLLFTAAIVFAFCLGAYVGELRAYNDGAREATNQCIEIFAPKKWKEKLKR